MSFDAIRENMWRENFRIYSDQLWSESQESKPHAYSTDALIFVRNEVELEPLACEGVMHHQMINMNILSKYY